MLSKKANNFFKKVLTKHVDDDIIVPVVVMRLFDKRFEKT